MTTAQAVPTYDLTGDFQTARVEVSFLISTWKNSRFGQHHEHTDAGGERTLTIDADLRLDADAASLPEELRELAYNAHKINRAEVQVLIGEPLYRNLVAQFGLVDAQCQAERYRVTLANAAVSITQKGDITVGSTQPWETDLGIPSERAPHAISRMQDLKFSLDIAL